MLTATFTFVFPGGGTAIAQLKAESADGEYDVVYSGAVELLPRRHEQADVGLLRAWAKNVVKETGSASTSRSKGNMIVSRNELRAAARISIARVSQGSHGSVRC